MFLSPAWPGCPSVCVCVCFISLDIAGAVFSVFLVDTLNSDDSEIHWHQRLESERYSLSDQGPALSPGLFASCSW